LTFDIKDEQETHSPVTLEVIPDTLSLRRLFSAKLKPLVFSLCSTSVPVVAFTLCLTVRSSMIPATYPDAGDAYPLWISGWSAMLAD
jgi:hypothetical protein